MTRDFPIPTGYNEQAILERLGKVLHPELDESMLKLGFIEEIEANNSHLNCQMK